MTKSKKNKIIDMTITINTKDKFFKVVDYDNNSNGGAISGGYKDKKHLINMFNDYFDKFIYIDCDESEDS